MSNEIYYDRAFIRVGELYIPMVSQGSSNTFTFNFEGREIPEKFWSVLNYRTRHKLLFTPDEIREIAADYERVSRENKDCYKTRYTRFMDGEFGRWIENGMKTAHTIEEYNSYGNTLLFLDYSRSPCASTPFASEELFQELYREAQSRHSEELDVRFEWSRGVHRPVRHRDRTTRAKPLRYFVLYDGFGYLKRVLSRGWVRVCSPEYAQCFRNKQEAQRYLEKYRNCLSRELEIAVVADSEKAV